MLFLECLWVFFPVSHVYMKPVGKKVKCGSVTTLDVFTIKSNLSHQINIYIQTLAFLVLNEYYHGRIQARA